MNAFKLLCLGVMAAGAVASSLAGDGSSMENAIDVTLSSKKPAGEAQVTLHPDGTNALQICYFKLKLEKGKAYTAWIDRAKWCDGNEHPAAPEIGIAYTLKDSSWDYDFYTLEPCAEFQSVTYGSQTRWVVDGEHWNPMDEDDWDDDWDDIHWKVQSSWNYYIVIRGEPGSTAMFNYALGNLLPLGIAANPQVLTPSADTEPGPVELGDFVDGPIYHLRATFKAGRRYHLASYGGDEAGDLYFGQLPKGLIKDSSDWATPHNQSKVIVPAEDTDCFFTLSTSREEKLDEIRASVRFRVDSMRKIKDHQPSSLTANQPVECSPGHINAKGTGSYDPIIDEVLYSFKAKKGKRYVAETFGAETNLLMRLYDDKGEIIAENRGNGSEDAPLDVRCAIPFNQTKDVQYYVGVCQDLTDDDEDEPTYGAVRFQIAEVVAVDGSPDGFDAADDTYKGANLLVAVPGHKDDDPTLVDAAGQGPHALDRGDWCDVFALEGRKGVTYFLRSSAAGAKAGNGYGLTAEVFTMSGSKEKPLTAFDLTPESIESGRFTAAANETYYLRVSVTEGEGLDYPAFKVHAIGCQFEDEGETNEVTVGQLVVRAQGTDAATWSLVTNGKVETVKYPNGASVLLPTNGTYAVRFYDVKGYSKPGDVPVVFDGTLLTVVDTAYYSDTSDPMDDELSGSTIHAGKTVKYAPTSWSLKATATEQSRTLWKTDPRDWFKFTASDGYYYDFKFASISEGGDAVMSLYEADGDTPAKDSAGQDIVGVDEIVKCGLAKGTYYLKVSHRNEGEKRDGSYVIQGCYANVGAIKFAKTEYTVKDNAASVTLTVNRTAKDGMLKVAFKTVDGTVKGRTRGASPDDPDEKFYTIEEDPSNVLVWEDGDNKAKTITVDLLPDLRPTYHDFLRCFTVELSDGGGDYPVVFSRDKSGNPLNVATVKLTETAKKTTGTVQVTGDGIDVKKPVYNVTAKETLNIKFVRADGTNGAITVKLDISALTGKPGDFREKTWADGKFEIWSEDISVPAATDEKTSKKVTLKLSATSKEKPKFAASSITVNVYNDRFLMTMADYVKALPKTAGYTVKEKKAGSWFVCNNGTMSGTGDLDFTLTGPCTFRYWINGVLQETIVVTAVEKTRKITIGACDGLTYEYVFNGDGGETIYQAVQYSAKVVCATSTAKPKLASGGKLPAGLKLEQDKATKEWFVRGVPTAAGYFYAAIEDSSLKPAVAMTNFAFNVVALRSAIGTFNGLAAAVDGHSGTNRLQSLAQVTLTTAASGKLSAKVALGGKTYNFAATGFEKVEEFDKLTLTAELTQIQKVKTQTFTNVLTATVIDADTTAPETWRTHGALLTLEMAALPDMKGSGFQKDVTYAGRAHRDFSKEAAWVTEAAKFAGYYTAALVPTNAVSEIGDKPTGNGYLTLTLDAKGKVKIAGMLANGTTYSASSVVGNLDRGGWDPVVTVPLYSFKNPTLFGGWLTIRFAEGEVPVVIQTFDDIRWVSEDATTDYDGKGFDLDLFPVGGYYDTVASLQRYYLDYRFAVEFPHDGDLANLETILKDTYGPEYHFVADANPNGMDVAVIGDVPSVDKQKLVKDGSTYDWASCVNAANLKLTFKRATGIVSGTCDLFYEGPKSGKTTAGKLSGLKHNGVLIMNREAEGPLPDNVWSAGSVVIPQSIRESGKTRKWNASFPFNIRATAP